MALPAIGEMPKWVTYRNQQGELVHAYKYPSSEYPCGYFVKENDGYLATCLFGNVDKQTTKAIKEAKDFIEKAYFLWCLDGGSTLAWYSVKMLATHWRDYDRICKKR